MINVTSLKKYDNIKIRWQGHSGVIYEWDCIFIELGYRTISHTSIAIVSYEGKLSEIPIKMIISYEHLKDFDLGI